MIALRSGRKQASGFTLVELLVAGAITTIIIVFLGTMLATVMNTTSRASNRTDAFRDARAALQMMQRDFAALVTVKPAAYFQIDTDLAGPDVRQLYGLIATRNRPPGVAPEVVGDVCAVRYYCSWDGRAYNLHRYFRNSALTIATIQSKLSGGTVAHSDAGALYYPADAADEPVAAYAFNLRVTAFDAAGLVVNKTSDSKGRDTTGAPYIVDPAGSTNPLPAAIEISFNAISPVAAQTVISATSGRADAYEVWKAGAAASPNAGDKALYDNLIAPHVYEFRTRINLK